MFVSLRGILKASRGKGFCWYIIYRYIIISAITLIMLIGFYRRPHISYQVVTCFILLYYIVKVGRMIVCILFTLSALKFELLSCLPSACFLGSVKKIKNSFEEEDLNHLQNTLHSIRVLLASLSL